MPARISAGTTVHITSSRVLPAVCFGMAEGLSVERARKRTSA